MAPTLTACVRPQDWRVERKELAPTPFLWSAHMLMVCAATVNVNIKAWGTDLLFQPSAWDTEVGRKVMSSRPTLTHKHTLSQTTKPQTQNNFFLFCFCFETRFIFGYPETLCRQSWPWTQKITCLYLPSARVKGMGYHTLQFPYCDLLCLKIFMCFILFANGDWTGFLKWDDYSLDSKISWLRPQSIKVIYASKEEMSPS